MDIIQVKSLDILLVILIEIGKKALEIFQKHQTTQYHRAASIKADNFLAVMAGESQSIDSQVDSVRTRQIQENQEKLAPIIKTVILCGRQGLPLRGHRDHGEFNVSVEPEENEGNFRALLRARIDSGDVNLKKHFETCPRNATYISWNIQNQIIEACDIIIKRKIASEVNSSKCFSILADETTDISTIEQCSICVRYVKNIGTSHNQFTICENFLTFVPIKSTCGKDLADAIINGLILCNIDVSNLRGQGYDGASNMSGHLKGTQACIAKDHPTALYVHCAAHNLNLAISSASGIPPIRNCMGTIEKVYTFFNTPIRQQVLQHQVQLLFPESRRDRMKQMCPTRWIQRHDSVMVMVQLLKPVHSALQEISLWKDKESSSGAFVLLSALAQSQFVISLFSVEKLLGYSLPLSKILQLENSDLAFAMDNAEETISSVKYVRDNAEEQFKNIFDEAKQIADMFDIEIKIPRLASKQTNRANVPTESAIDYYRKSVFIPWVDSFLSGLEDRFTQHKSLLKKFMVLLPAETFPSG